MPFYPSATLTAMISPRGNFLEQTVSLSRSDGLVSLADVLWVSPALAQEIRYPEETHLLKIAAILQRYPQAVIAGISALILRGIPVPSVPEEVDVFLGDRRGGSVPKLVRFRSQQACRIARHVQLVPSSLPQPRLWISATNVVEATLDAIRWGAMTLRDAVILIDSAANALSSKIESFTFAYQAQVEADSRYRRQVIDRALVLACAGVQSPMETRLRLKLYERGYPAPFVQLKIDDRDHSHLGRPDLTYPDKRVSLEYDGFEKFHEQFGVDAVTAVNKHRRRSDRLASQGMWMIHVDSQGWTSGEWLTDLNEALRRNVDPFPASQLRNKQIAWPEKFDKHPQWRWKLDR